MVAVEELSDLPLKIEIFPNPNNGEFVLRITNNEQGITNYEVKVYNILGEVVFQSTYEPINPSTYEPINPSTYQPINLNQQPAGVYFVEVRVGSEVAGRAKVITLK